MLMPDLSIAEAAQVLGYSTDTVRRGLTKGTGPLGRVLKDAGRRMNDGRWIVSLMPAEIERHRRKAGATGQPKPATIAVAQAGVEDEVVRLRQELETYRTRAAVAEALAAERLEGIADLRRRLDVADTAHAAERAQLVEMIERLSDRPWWRRVFC